MFRGEDRHVGLKRFSVFGRCREGGCKKSEFLVRERAPYAQENQMVAWEVRGFVWLTWLYSVVSLGPQYMTHPKSEPMQISHAARSSAGQEDIGPTSVCVQSMVVTSSLTRGTTAFCCCPPPLPSASFMLGAGLHCSFLVCFVKTQGYCGCKSHGAHMVALHWLANPEVLFLKVSTRKSTKRRVKMLCFWESTLWRFGKRSCKRLLW